MSGALPTRRTFLKAAAVTAAGAAGAIAVSANGTPASAAPARRVRRTREEHRVVVVGSGFGGGVSALRLAQAGVPVLMLERGRRWPTGPNSETFPRALNPDKRVLWHESTPNLFGKPLSVEPYVGLIESVTGANMTALCPAGLGGGSLVYQGMTLQPSEAVFNEHFPNALDWQLMNRVHYPRVAKMLKVAVAPDSVVRSPQYLAPRQFAKRVRAEGLPLQKIPMPIDWGYAEAELRGEMKAAYSNGDGSFGVNNGGKHSVDVTYIRQAEATGLVTVRTLHTVRQVSRRKDGKWSLHVERTDEAGKVLEHKEIITKTLIMAAGSVNTTKLLVRAREAGTISDLPDGLGRGWGTNADRIYTWTSPSIDFGTVQGGPVVYGSLNWSDPKSAFTVVQASIPPMPVSAKTTMLVGFGVSSGRGVISYDSGAGDAIIKWPHEGDSEIQTKHIDGAVRRIAGPDAILTDTNAFFPSTWHALGGANMGTVCDLEGRVTGQPGLYVLDGALMPGTTAACNPSMTIAAVAERALDHIVAKDVGSTI
ncbi:GMC oxidoreductase [Gordonia rubripertincta]|uniref:GMC oxidoreductase n=1 Tax=Gordonia rubripertincta TaxID=36822 RepID=UPI0015FE2EC4|nr:GMC oxidoreductase [Gordonia rubripertincta]QMU21609.1 GMC family oxidoreductase [Gordonia rubripertincta]